jgi:hypothetical protein
MEDLQGLHQHLWVKLALSQNGVNWNDIRATWGTFTTSSPQRRHSDIVPRTPLGAKVTTFVQEGILETLKQTDYVPVEK